MKSLRNVNISAIARGLCLISRAFLTVASLSLPAAAMPAHGLAMYGEPALSDGFGALPYVNPEAPQGGTIRLAEPGGFDSLNAWVLKGNAAAGVATHVVETLMYRSLDEPFTLYGLLARSVEVAPDRSWVEFALRPEARFSDGSPVTVGDVIWSFQTLGTQGHPRYRAAWDKVARIEQTGPDSLRITFAQPDRELPMLMGLRPVLKKSQWSGKDFTASSLEVPIGSGAYVVDSVEPGRSVTFRRDPGYWGRDLPVNRGRNNLDRIRYDYFADANAMFEAFKAGEVTVWRELSALAWDRDYDFPRMQRGDTVRAEIPHGRPSGIMGLVMNTRNPLFADWRVRQAMIEAFNFRFINATLNAGKERRITSYFANSGLAMQPGAATGREAALLDPFAAELPPGTLEGYELPPGSDRALDRAGLRRAIALLSEAGWTVRDGVLQDATGRPFAFEILLNQSGSAMRSASETQQIADIYVQALHHLGMRPRITLLDSAQFVQRTNGFHFDMTWYERALSLSPGTEQRLYWGAAAADQPGSRNWMGVKSAAVEAVIAAMLASQNDADFTAAARALDRILMAGRYVIPVGFSPASRLAHAANLRYPAETTPLYGDWPGFMPELWWQEAEE